MSKTISTPLEVEVTKASTFQNIVSGTTQENVNLATALSKISKWYDEINAKTPDQTYNSSSTRAQSGVAIESKKPGLKTDGTSYTIGGETVVAGSNCEIFNDYEGNMAIGHYSHAEGVDSVAKEYASHAEGEETVTSGSASHAEGSGSEASGDYSHAEGEYSEASGSASHSEGSHTTASGDYSHAEGYYSEASGESSHAEGSETTASGDYSHAEGSETTASGDYSHAGGNGCTASGINAFAVGESCTASGNYSAAIGQWVSASSANQFAIGKNSSPDTVGKYAFIIGNGTTNGSSRTLHNGFAIDWNGLIYVNGATTGVDVAALAATIGDINTVLESVL